MEHYTYRRMANIHYELQLAEGEPWFEVILIDPLANVAMPAEEHLRKLTENEAKQKCDELNAQIDNN